MVNDVIYRYSSAAKVLRVSSLCEDFPCGFAGEVYGSECHGLPLLQNLSSDQYVLSELGSIHVPVRKMTFAILLVKLLFNLTAVRHLS